MAARSSMLHVRVDDETKVRASETLEAMGLTVSDAVRIFLRRVVRDQAFPFELKAPTAETRAAMAEANDILRTRRARFATPDQLLNDLEATRGE